MFLARHGDVAIKEIASLPEKLNKIEGTTIALGEATGHHHTLVTESQTKVELFTDSEGKMYFEISGGPATLTHQEHKPITFAPGKFMVGFEREYDPLTEWRKVQD